MVLYWKIESAEKLMVPNSDMCKVESCCKVLEAFEEVTDILGGQNCITGLLVLVVLHNLIKALEPKVNKK
jgi:hypothetical protein